MSTVRDLLRLETDAQELLARHQNGRDLKSFAKYKGKPVAFMETELDFHPYPKQVEIIESFLANRQTAVRGFHGAGKDAVLSPLMLYACYCEQMLVLAISATERQLLGQLWVEVKRRFSAKLPGELYSSVLRINGVDRIIAMTSGSTSNLTGWHDANGVFIAVSESQSEQVEAAAYTAALANAVDSKSRVVVVGNPVANAGMFYEVSHRPTWNAIKIAAADHPNISEGREVIPGGPSPDFPARMAAEWGADSDWYRSRVDAEWPGAGADSVFRSAWIEAAFVRHETNALALLAQQKKPYLVADIARAGADSTCAAVMQGGILSPFKTWHEPDLMQTAERLDVWSKELGFPYVGRVRPDPWEIDEARVRVMVDDAGVGGGVTDRLRQLGGRVVPFNGGTRANREERFANARAESYFALRELMMRERVALPRDMLLREELLATEYGQNAAGKIQLISKDDIRAKIRRSPDRADVAAMAAWRMHAAHTVTQFEWNI